MNREKAIKFLGIGGQPAGVNAEGRVLFVFARQGIDDVERIEKLSTKELIARWKGRVWMNEIYGQVSISDMQEIILLEMEMKERKVNWDVLDRWYDKAKKKFDKSVERGEY